MADWKPHTLVEDDGAIYSYDARPDGEKRCRIYGSVSREGERFEDLPEPLVSSTGADAWDGDGVGCAGVSVAEVADGYIMAFVGSRFPRRGSIGLAVGETPDEWSKLPFPVVESGDVFLDDGGLISPALVVREDQLDIYYVGIADLTESLTVFRECLREDGSRSRGGGPALARIQLGPPPRPND